ncbi:helix-turn-helix domain-containing protein [Anaerotruncus rubiinfantis]|uniref:helix-turn-helix domain-containing protein n=1 Tax=Anaerotruncus rubiinfantis TaxID=1720200 RepID=UPI0034A2ADE2
MKFNELIRSKGFTVKSLAEATGVSPRTLEQYSSGRFPVSNMRAYTFVPLCEVLDMTPRELLEIEQ